jgi:glycosyl transferase family 25
MVALPIFVINLDKDTRRLARMVSEFERQHIEFQRIPGIKGLEVPSWLVDQFRSADLLPGEIGCYASHLVAAKTLLESGQPAAAIFEDDVILLDGLENALQQTLEHAPRDWDLINVAISSRRSMLSVSKMPLGRHIVRYSRYPWGVAGYLLSRTGAQKLLAERPRSVPFDVELRHPWRSDLNCYGVEPLLVRQTDDFGSSISTTREPAKNLSGGQLWYIRTLGFRGLALCALANITGSVKKRLGYCDPKSAGKLIA